MITVSFAPKFTRKIKKLEPALREEVYEAVNLFYDEKNHKKLKVHPLRGKLQGRWSFSVNYRYRIMFRYIDSVQKKAELLSVGDHDIYKNK